VVVIATRQLVPLVGRPGRVSVLGHGGCADSLRRRQTAVRGGYEAEEADEASGRGFGRSVGPNSEPWFSDNSEQDDDHILPVVFGLLPWL
jgi:hypothetical protein